MGILFTEVTRKMEKVQKQPNSMTKRLEHCSYKEEPEKLGLLSIPRNIKVIFEINNETEEDKSIQRTFTENKNVLLPTTLIFTLGTPHDGSVKDSDVFLKNTMFLLKGMIISYEEGFAPQTKLLSHHA